MFSGLRLECCWTLFGGYRALGTPADRSLFERPVALQLGASFAFQDPRRANLRGTLRLHAWDRGARWVSEPTELDLHGVLELPRTGALRMTLVAAGGPQFTLHLERACCPVSAERSIRHWSGTLADARRPRARLRLRFDPRHALRPLLRSLRLSVQLS